MNGFKNRQTWNVCLWIGNDEALYHEARRAWRLRSRHGSPYRALIALLGSDFRTGDGVRLGDSRISRREVSACIKELAL